MRPVKSYFFFVILFLYSLPCFGQVPAEDAALEAPPPAGQEIHGGETVPSPAVPDTAEQPRAVIPPAVTLPAADAHRGAVTALAADGEPAPLIYSAGADGFLGFWDNEAAKAVERFQLSSRTISHIAFRPSASAGERSHELAVAENGSNGSSVSLWDLRARTKRFSTSFKYPVSFLSWSAAGSFLIAATSGAPGIVFLNPENGAFLDGAPVIADRIVFAGTGKSEKSMVTYSPSGFLSYWDFDTNEEIRRYPLSRSLSSVLLFGARRFFSGIGSDGLSVYDAVSGNLIARDRSVTRGKLASADPESADFFVLEPNAAVQYYLTSHGQLETLKKIPLPPLSGGAASFLPLKDGRIVLGGASGGLFLLEPGGALTTFRTETQTRVTWAAVSGPFIALLAEDKTGKTAGLVPLDYRELRQNMVLPFTANLEANTRITPVNPPAQSGRASFILWQPDTFRRFPSVWTGAFSGGAFSFARSATLVKLPLGANLRAVSVYRGQALFLTARGALQAVSLEPGPDGLPPDGTPLWNHQAIGAADAAWINDRAIILGRNALNGPPFFTMSSETGASVPLPDTAGLGSGIHLYPGMERLYGVSVSRTREGFFTRVIAISANGQTQSALAAYPGEDPDMSVAGITSGEIAVNPGGEHALELRSGTIFQRSAGFPLRVLGGSSSFVILDTEGNLVWIDPKTGLIQARFALYGSRWLVSVQGGALIEGNR